MIVVFWLSMFVSPGSPAEDTGEAEDQVLGGQARQGCFYTREASNFDVLDKSNLIVYAPTKSRAYHVRIAPPSHELRHANRIAFEGRSGRICGYAGESVSFGGGIGARRYSVANVWRLNEAALEQLKDAYQAGDGEMTPEPRPTEGAEVERDLSGADEE